MAMKKRRKRKYFGGDDKRESASAGSWASVLDAVEAARLEYTKRVGKEKSLREILGVAAAYFASVSPETQAAQIKRYAAAEEQPGSKMEAFRRQRANDPDPDGELELVEAGT